MIDTSIRMAGGEEGPKRLKRVTNKVTQQKARVWGKRRKANSQVLKKQTQLINDESDDGGGTDREKRETEAKAILGIRR